MHGAAYLWVFMVLPNCGYKTRAQILKHSVYGFQASPKQHTTNYCALRLFCLAERL